MKKEHPKQGDTKIVEYFAILPVKVGLETRWFEKVKVLQKFVESTVSPLGEYFTEYWSNIKFIEDEN